MAKRKKQRIRLVSEEFDPGPGLRAFADVLAPKPPPPEPEPRPVRQYFVTWRCPYAVTDCKNEEQHQRHPNPWQLVEDPATPEHVVLAVAGRHAGDLAIYRSLVLRPEVSLDRVLVEGKTSYTDAWYLSARSYRPGVDYTRAGGDTADQRLEALLAARKLSLAQGRKIAKWKGLSAEAMLALLEYFDCDARIVTELVAAQIPGPDAKACAEACAATGTWRAQVTAAFGQISKEPLRPSKLQALVGHAERRTGGHLGAPEAFRALCPGWTGTPQQLVDAVTLLLNIE